MGKIAVPPLHYGDSTAVKVWVKLLWKYPQHSSAALLSNIAPVEFPNCSQLANKLGFDFTGASLRLHDGWRRISSMPFTLSHAAAVLPLFRWRRLDPLALVIGSMAPDFGYFLHRFYLASQAHTIRGSIVLALPLAWVAWLGLRIFAASLCSPLPEPDRGALQSFLTARPFGIRSIGWVTLSLLLGIWSHTVLDSFTHEGGWTVSHVGCLHSPWPVYQMLQHSGSVAGMLVLLVVYFRWRTRHYGAAIQWTRGHTILTTLVIVSAVAAFPMAWSFATRFEGSLMLRALVFRWIVGSIGFFCVAYFVWGLLLRSRVGR